MKPCAFSSSFWMVKLFIGLLLLFLLELEVLGQSTSTFKKLKVIPEKYQILPLGEVNPTGWIKDQIQENLNGFTGHLDSLAPDLILDDDIYGKNRLSKKVKSKDVGALGVAGDWQVQFLWWNSETQSNWRDGYIRSAILANDSKHLDKIKNYIQQILATQDADGYLGIYDQELRYHFDNENGELWSKASLLRGLLAWYDYKKEKKVLMAIERSAQNVMKNYPMYQSHPFYSTNPNVGGVTHGLTITDVFESLYRITKKQAYLDYCLFLYEDFSSQQLNEDAQYSKLINESILLNGHSVHTYEHLRSLAAAYHASGNENLKKAMDQFISKIEWATTASGAAVGDEWIGGKKADATHRGYEYCSLHELMHGYLNLFVKSGASHFAERAEKIFLNPAQGARYPDGTAITYLKSDNSYALTGGLNGDISDPHQTRFRYSPVHKEAAVCCVPNAGRIAPYYVQHMWLKEKNSLVNALLGPSEVNTQINGKSVTVIADTQFPLAYDFRFTVTTIQNNFLVKIRIPQGVSKFSVSESYSEENGFIVINKTWSGTQTITITFYPEVVKHLDGNQETYFTYGALVLALPIASVETKTKTYPIKGFYDFSHIPQNLVVYEYIGEPIVQVGNKPLFKTILFNPINKQKEKVELVPMEKTILRQVTFKNANP
jgi:uncharacterized protein